MSETPLVIVLDDDEGIRSVMEPYLDYLGYASLAFEDGRQALDLLRTLTKPCIILLDWMMPVMHGSEFLDMYAMFGLDQLHAVIVMSAGDVTKCQHAAIRERLAKPFEVEVLKDMLDKMAEKLHQEVHV